MKALLLTKEQVKATRQFFEESQYEFAERVGCSREQLQRYEQHGLPARMNRLVRSNLLHAASEAGVTTSDESIAGVLID